MKIDVKNIKFHPGHDDGYSYTAVILVDGVKAFTAFNNGRGGPDAYSSVAGYNGPSQTEIDAWLVANTPKHVGQYGEFDNSLELVVGEFLEAAERNKEFVKVQKKWQKLLLNSVTEIDGDKIMTWKAEPTADMMKRLRDKYPVKTFINDASDQVKADAMKLYAPGLF